MKTLPLVIAIVVSLLSSSGWSFAAEPAATLNVHADQVTGKISPLTLGACIEDVNHEIYGGLYSQMVVGESFQEPAPTAAPEAHRLRWQLDCGR